MSSIMNIIGLLHPGLFALELGKKNTELGFVTLLHLQILTKLGQNKYNHRSRMSSIMDLTGPELSELSFLELEKNGIFDFVYKPASTNIDQSTLN